ncbi:aminopeptidase P family protein [Streptococcus minor]|uniref:Aminopeptidase P family protein n=1 Tax=Streptococcus minor TaxID=229549 RepID=A0A3P1VCJ0_9STRE|nr:Xaa-Pro peptidase family protein [Streptococcus minor]MDO5078313.1 Xaa-Pro peptidase family protein [Streptococcus minor]RRD31397.1 aminopeptidase P family protein [Streptococcus minor]
MSNYLAKRLAKFEAALDEAGVDGILVTNLTNIYYLTGFSGTSATLFISKKRRIFVTDARYTLIAKSVVKDFDILDNRDALGEIAKVIADDKLATIGFDSQVTYGFYQQLSQNFADYELKSLTGFVEKLRMIKDDSEIATIRHACSISDKAFIDVLDFIKPGQTTELQVANFLDFRMREYGASGVSFETIAASGYRSAMPHGVASDKVIETGESLTLDFGCYYNHYVSDMTRTVHIGQVTDQEREIYDVVLRANQALIEKAKAGLSFADFDGIPRSVIAEAGYGPHFTHSIGHGMGLDVHEIPYFGPASTGQLEVGMVVTDEPGIYLDNQYGLRIEDDLLITETGCEVLTLAPKELIVL